MNLNEKSSIGVGAKVLSGPLLLIQIYLIQYLLDLVILADFGEIVTGTFDSNTSSTLTVISTSFVMSFLSSSSSTRVSNIVTDAPSFCVPPDILLDRLGVFGFGLALPAFFGVVTLRDRKSFSSGSIGSSETSLEGVVDLSDNLLLRRRGV